MTDSTEQPKRLMMDINQVEQNVILELETWKKNEEAKFKLTLKEREFEFLQHLQTDWKNKDAGREKTFKQLYSQMQTIENKMKQKCSELLKREQKIVQQEEELKLKLAETAKLVKQKEEEQGALIKKYKDERLAQEKEKTSLNLKLTDAQQQIQKLQEDILKVRKDMENSPIALVKGDLQKKIQEINELKKEIEKINQIKEQYKIYYEKVLEEVTKQKRINEELKMNSQVFSQNELLKIKEELENLKRVQLMASRIEPVQAQANSNPLQQYPLQQSLNTSAFERQNKPQVEISRSKSINQQQPNSQKQTFQNNPPNDLQRLIQERAFLILSGEYLEDDPLIQEMTRNIQQLGGE